MSFFSCFSRVPNQGYISFEIAASNVIKRSDSKVNLEADRAAPKEYAIQTLQRLAQQINTVPRTNWESKSAEINSGVNEIYNRFYHKLGISGRIINFIKATILFQRTPVKQIDHLKSLIEGSLKGYVSFDLSSTPFKTSIRTSTKTHSTASQALQKLNEQIVEFNSAHDRRHLSEDDKTDITRGVNEIYDRYEQKLGISGRIVNWVKVHLFSINTPLEKLKAQKAEIARHLVNSR